MAEIEIVPFVTRRLSREARIARLSHFKGPVVGHKPNVVEALHSPVANVKLNHSIRFLHGGSFVRLGTNERRPHGQEHWRGSKFRLRINGIAKSDIDLH